MVQGHARLRKSSLRAEQMWDARGVCKLGGQDTWVARYRFGKRIKIKSHKIQTSKPLITSQKLTFFLSKNNVFKTLLMLLIHNYMICKL